MNNLTGDFNYNGVCYFDVDADFLANLILNDQYPDLPGEGGGDTHGKSG